MKILMLGWEYPPIISGGLGIASQGIAQALSLAGHDVTFFLPKLALEHLDDQVKLMDASGLKISPKRWKEGQRDYEIISELEIGSALIPYLGVEYFTRKKERTVERERVIEHVEVQAIEAIKLSGSYGPSLMEEVVKYSLLAVQYAHQEGFDIVHCHDWMTFPAGNAIKESCQIPFIAHIHSTEEERNGLHGHPQIIQIESAGLKNADLIFSVSDQTAKRVAKNYELPTSSIRIIPNGNSPNLPGKRTKKHKQKVIGFVGRFTDQKNPKKFLEIARMVASQQAGCSFLMVGDGHLMEEIRNLIETYNLNSSITLTGFLPHIESLSYMSQMDVLLVPSNAEPFGLVPLEAIQSGVPVLVAEKCGIADFVPSLTQIPTWDSFGWVKAIDQLLDDSNYKERYVAKCQKESKELTWSQAAKLSEKAYSELMTPSYD